MVIVIASKFAGEIALYFIPSDLGWFLGAKVSTSKNETFGKFLAQTIHVFRCFSRAFHPFSNDFSPNLGVQLGLFHNYGYLSHSSNPLNRYGNVTSCNNYA